MVDIHYLLLENLSLPVGHHSPSFRELALVFQGLHNQHNPEKKDRLYIFQIDLKVFESSKRQKLTIFSDLLQTSICNCE